MEKKNLLVKLRKKLKKMKKVAALGLAGLAIAGALSSCAPLVVNTDTNSTDSTVTDTQTGEHDYSNEILTINALFGLPGIKLSDYSEIFQKLMTDSRYDTRYEQFQDVIHSNGSFNIADPIPYGFLERNGFDVSAIKAEKLECDSYVYRPNNDKDHLYVNLRAEKNVNGTICSMFYTLKYKISEKEFAEFDELAEGAYADYCFYIDALDRLREPEVVSQAGMISKTYIKSLQEIKNGWNGKYPGITNVGSLQLIDFSVENQDGWIYLTSPALDLEDDYDCKGTFIIGKQHVLPYLMIGNFQYFDQKENIITGEYKYERIFDIEEDMDGFEKTCQKLDYYGSSRWAARMQLFKSELQRYNVDLNL